MYHTVTVVLNKKQQPNIGDIIIIIIPSTSDLQPGTAIAN